ncbi:alpha/beta fold hydrolase [Corynebacterium sp. TAE3-ERU12]|uniref:alpha/beta fold hydrolase n=1 Tax=Corynebacterium sp. TAE3-ERU12 TaxID=2849491 RepID=UPI00351CF704
MSTQPHAKTPDRIVPITMPDGSTTPLRLYFPQGFEKRADGDADAAIDAPRGIVIIWPGFGMGGHYYWPMARELAERGYVAVISELRGQGDQSAVASHFSVWGYHEIASQDMPMTVAEARRVVGEEVPVFFMCHSMGGQIATCYLGRDEADIDGAMYIGSGTPYVGHFTGADRRRLRIGAPVMRVVSAVLGFWPSGPLDLAGYGRQSRRHLWQWSGMAMFNRLRVRNADIDYYTAAGTITTPVLLTTCAGDDDCNSDSAKALTSWMPQAARFEFIDERLGHNRWAREPKVIADRFEQFVGELDAPAD